MVIALQLPSIIVTIGTLILYRGLAQIIAGDKSIRVPEWFIGINKVMVAGIPLPVLIFVVRGARPGAGAGRHDLRPADLPDRHERGRGAPCRHPHARGSR